LVARASLRPRRFADLAVPGCRPGCTRCSRFRRTSSSPSNPYRGSGKHRRRSRPRSRRPSRLLQYVSHASRPTLPHATQEADNSPPPRLLPASSLSKSLLLATELKSSMSESIAMCSLSGVAGSPASSWCSVLLAFRFGCSAIVSLVECSWSVTSSLRLFARVDGGVVGSGCCLRRDDGNSRLRAGAGYIRRLSA